MEKLKNNKVLLGLSGGVDSTTAALLLKEKGLEVIGYYFDPFGGNEMGKAEAAAVAEQLGIEFYAEDVSDDFKAVVVENFCSEYLCGRTPYPCIVCNPNIKFRKLINKADELGAYYIATGHYAQMFHNESTGKYYVRMGANIKKDQSYMLYRLQQDVLSRLIFPLGHFMDKEETRNIARQQNLSNAEKKDSQEICFVPDDDYVAYIEARGQKTPEGNFVDKDGKILGKHKGIINYTIGQRKGLGIALGKPAFVTKIDAKRNEVVLGDNDDLFTREVVSVDNVFAAGEAIEHDGMRVAAKVRYSAKPSPAVLNVDAETGTVTTVFDEPQRAATPGQSIVFYMGDVVIGGGFIK